jgi:uncharacterized protein
MSDLPFWESKTLDELTHEEWEALCDNCGRCCLFKLQDEETGEIFYTNVVCRLMDLNTCCCTTYKERSTLVPTCLTLTPEMVRTLNWLPETCAYHLVAQGKKLPWWHPLISGNPGTPRKAGISVQGNIIPEADANMDRLDDYVIE